MGHFPFAGRAELVTCFGHDGVEGPASGLQLQETVTVQYQ